MTRDQKEQLSRITWPLVALVVVAGGFFLGLFALADTPGDRTALLGLLTLLSSGVVTVVTQRLSHKVSRVERSAVSRETSRGVRVPSQNATHGDHRS